MEREIVLPAPVRSILTALQQQGHSAFAVGGCVRDSLLGRTPCDWDVCTSARPGEIRAAFPGKCLSAPGVRHGTITVLLEHTPYEVTTFRTDGAYSDHRHPDGVRFVRSLAQDLARRDFTINAMAYSPASGLIDPFGGARDLAAKRLCCVGSPAQRFSEDALRILRMARFAASMGFSIEPRTEAAALRQCGVLAQLSAERCRGEFCKMLCGRWAARVLYGQRALLVPLLPGAAKVSERAWEEAVAAIAAAPAELCVRLGILCRVVSPAQLAPLCPDAKTAQTAALLAEYAEEPLRALPSMARRWLHRLGPEVLQSLVCLQTAFAAARGDAAKQAELAEFAAQLRRAAESGACYTRAQLAVNGTDALGAGIPAGAQVGAALEALLERVIEGTLPNERGVLLKQLAAWRACAACEQCTLSAAKN